MAHFLVTGGAGFIGSHLVDALLAAGHKVRVLDNLSSGSMDNVPAEAELIVADVTDPDCVRRALDGVEGCFHLAAVASVERCRSEWFRSHTVNLGGAIVILDEVRRARALSERAIPVVYASSAAVYGEASAIPIAESAVPNPTSAYGVDKLACEMHAAVASRDHNLRTVGLRFFNVYGPRQNPTSPYSGVISIFCHRILQGAPLEIQGDGTQVRDFVYVADAVVALQRAMDTAQPIPQVFNVCTGSGTSISELGSIIAKLCEVPSYSRYVPARAGDLQLSIGDPRRARDMLKFCARTPLPQGLARTLAFLRHRASEADALQASSA